MKTLLALLLVVVATSQAHAASPSLDCMQTHTNDSFLPNHVTLYPAQDGNIVRAKFYIENDQREVIANKVAEDEQTIQFGHVRLLENGAPKGGPIGIKYSLKKSAFSQRGELTWKYFDGSEATYSCSSN
ncbi:hypothetical protein [Bdellovibrio sp. GT3]|uniref:hypothetical protein n=1 Tax=Bdellovibrio sp. GT3 TaxID=3136282 RepID=UPI0030F24474